MADMYGALRSSYFRVKNTAAFKEWFDNETYFGSEIELWIESNNTVAFGGYEQYPCAYPRMPMDEEGEYPEWELQSFAAELREHLDGEQEVVVMAAGHEKLRYVAATILIVPREGPALFLNIQSDDDDVLEHIRKTVT